MPRKTTGKTTTSQFKRKQKNGDVYVYDRILRYNPDKGYTEQLSCKLIGKIPAGGNTMVDTRPRNARCSDVVKNLSAERKTVGAMDILEWAGRESGIDEDMLASADLGTAQKILSIARFWTSNPGETIPRIEEWQIEHPVPYKDGLSEDIRYTLMEEVGRNVEIQQKYFTSRAGRAPSRASVAVDSTTVSSYSGQLNDVRFGYSKDGDGLATVKLLTLFCMETHQPIAFARQPGNIPDVISVSNAIRQLNVFGMEKPLAVLDGGYYSEENLFTLIKGSTKFLMRGQLDARWILPEYKKCMDELELPSHSIPGHEGIYGTMAAIMHEFQWIRQRGRGRSAKGDIVTESHRVYLYFFCDSNRARIDKAAFMRRIQQVKGQLETGVDPAGFSKSKLSDMKKYLDIRNTRGGMKVSINDEACLKAMQYYGCFVFVSNTRMEAGAAYDTYLLREKTEENFRLDKQYNDAARTRSKGTSALDGRFFCQFVAMGYEQFLYEQIRRLKSELAVKTGEPGHDSAEMFKAEKNF